MFTLHFFICYAHTLTFTIVCFNMQYIFVFASSCSLSDTYCMIYYYY